MAIRTCRIQGWAILTQTHRNGGPEWQGGLGIGNKEDRSCSWSQEVLYMVMTYANMSVKKYGSLCAICIGWMAVVNRELSRDYQQITQYTSHTVP